MILHEATRDIRVRISPAIFPKCIDKPTKIIYN